MKTSDIYLDKLVLEGNCLVKASRNYMEACNSMQEHSEKGDIPQHVIDSVSDCHSALNQCIHYWNKRVMKILENQEVTKIAAALEALESTDEQKLLRADAERWRIWSRHVGRPQRRDLGPQIPAQTWTVLVTGLQDNVFDAADGLIRSNTPANAKDAREA